MKSAVPKQFLRLNGDPILFKTVKCFFDTVKGIEAVVVLPKNHLTSWDDLKHEYPILEKVRTVIGGATRTASVMNGLAVLPENGLVAIHDAVRPFVERTTIEASFESAAEVGSGIAAVQLKDSIRELKGDHSIVRDRTGFVLVQTPQTFRLAEIKEAYRLKSDAIYTDDASVFEAAGNQVHLIEGSYSNIKITTPEDLK